MTVRTVSKLRFATVRAMIACLAPLAFMASAMVHAASVVGDSIQIQTYPTHSRLVLNIDENVATRWKTSAHGFELLLKGIGLLELGAPLGQEERWARQFESIEDPRISSIKFTETPDGVRIEGKWKFPQGQAALADPKMEAFDYRDKKTLQYLVDFWVKKGPTLAEVKTAERQKVRSEAIRKAQDEAKRRSDRKIASEKARAVANDVTRFCREPLNDKSDLFLPFHPYHENFDFTKWIATTTPDTNFTYFEPKSKEREAQYVRLALSLYRQGDMGLVVRTLEFFEKEFPSSNFRWEMRFLQANALIRLNLPDSADKILRRLMVEAKDAPVALHSGMFLAARTFHQKQYLQALEAFLWLVQHHPEHRLSWVFHMGAAESMYVLKQTDRAQKEYQWVMEHGPTRREKVEAAIRYGDLFQDRFQYEQALGSYFQALTHFKDEALAFPAIHLNRGEALYHVGQRERAKEAFEEFLRRFPSHPAGWRATFRLGEIYGREPGEKSAGVSRQWFYETVNRFPFTAGATLARLRLVECGDHGGFTPEAAERFFAEEAENFDGKGSVSLVHYPELRALAHVRSLITWGHEEDAADVAIAEMQAQRNIDFRKRISNLFTILFRRYVEKLLDEGRPYDALKFYSEKSRYVQELGTPVENEYLLKLSQAASDMGLGKLGVELAETYRKATNLSLRRELASTDKSDFELDRRLNESHQAYSEAKAVWAASGIKEAGKVRELLAKVVDESPSSYGREIILGLMDQRQGKAASALVHAARAQLTLPGDSPKEEALRVNAWLAELQAQAGDGKVALELYRSVERNLKNVETMKKRSPASSRPEDEEEESATDTAGILGVPDVPPLEQVILAQAEVLEKQSRWGEASVAYSKAVDAGIGGNRAVYGYARALLKTGGAETHNKAIGYLEKVASSKTNDSWKRLASETLANEKSRQLTQGNAKEGVTK